MDHAKTGYALTVDCFEEIIKIDYGEECCSNEQFHLCGDSASMSDSSVLYSLLGVFGLMFAPHGRLCRRQRDCGLQQGATKDKVVASLFNPSARTFAKATLGKVGCGKASVFGYWPHELQILPLKMLPNWVTEKIILEATRKEIENEKQGR